MLLHLAGAEPQTLFDSALGVTQIVTPWIAPVGLLLGAVVLGFFNSHNRRKGNHETRAPDVDEAWAEARMANHELDVERRWRRRLQDYAWEVRMVLHSYVDRVQGGGSTEMTAREYSFYESSPPTDEIKVKTPPTP